jgi:hypothetical protein
VKPLLIDGYGDLISLDEPCSAVVLVTVRFPDLKS